MIVLDTIDLPKISNTLELSATGLSWVQNAYMLAFGELLLLGVRGGTPRKARASLLVR